MISFGVTPQKAEQLRERMEQLAIRESDLDESFVRSGGPGGQKVNRTASCVRLHHRPSGLEVKMQKARTQPLNRYYARKRLCELLEAQELGDESPAERERRRIAKQKARRRRRGPSRSD